MDNFSKTVPGFFFILGRGRSGTWLLQSILDQHPLLGPAPEALFIISLMKKYEHVTSWDHQLLRNFIDDLWQEKRLGTWWELEKKELEESIMQFEGDFSFSRLCLAVYQTYAVKKNKPVDAILGDKNPTYTLFIPELLDLFPSARFICMVRDYRDNILSFQKATFDLKDPVSLAQRWEKYNSEILKYSKIHPDKFMVVQFENFLASPEKYLTAICRFLGVEFNEAMLEFYKKKRKLQAWQHNLDKPIDKSRVNAWEGKMTESNVRKTESVCGKLGEQFGYKAKYPGQSSHSSMIIQLGKIKGKFFNFLEHFFFSIPFGIRTPLLNIYRKISKTAG